MNTYFIPAYNEVAFSNMKTVVAEKNRRAKMVAYIFLCIN